MNLGDSYKKLEKYVLSETTLQQYSFPRPHPRIKGQAIISNARSKYVNIPSAFTRKCRRCEVNYDVGNSGDAVRSEVCSYHSYGKPNPGKPYRCCGGSATARPCQTASQHVHGNIDFSNMTGFLLTKDNTSVAANEVYAVDCEMVYTVAGMEIACISVVNTKCEMVYETMVIPDTPILDYNTEFSNIKASDFIGVKTTMKDVHAKLMTLWGPNTILVGHGLESDLIKLRIIHDKVLDTLVLYPHPKGLPFLSSLQYLKDKYVPYCVNAGTNYKCGKDAIAVIKLALLKR